MFLQHIPHYVSSDTAESVWKTELNSPVFDDKYTSNFSDLLRLLNDFQNTFLFLYH